ncbi:hypothetical protein [Priestia megaterium]|uniref:hypothetical protein n=1 Tax=Priestia megaterium TaxID=1404 RepID=UPI0023DBEC4E|nr:hypothetical protein [Priestia megaterium]MDF2010197.1 hypothetical protein [Priestia megaterium]
MKVESAFTFLNDSGIHAFYPLQFPSNNVACSVVTIDGGLPSRAGVQNIYLRVLTRDKHPKKVIDIAHEIKNHLYKMKGGFFDGKEVLKIQENTPEPLYIGEEKGLYLASWNYTILEG